MRSSSRSAFLSEIPVYFSCNFGLISVSSRKSVKYPITLVSGVFKSWARYTSRSFFRCSASLASCAVRNAFSLAAFNSSCSGFNSSDNTTACSGESVICSAALVISSSELIHFLINTQVTIPHPTTKNPTMTATLFCLIKCKNT